MKERIKNHDRANTILRNLLGANLYGGPNYRMVRTEGRLEYFSDKEGYTPKYPDEHCWVLEKWCPPEQYGSRADWERPGAELGPFPNHGDYETMWRLEKLQGEDFSDQQLETIAWAIAQNRNMTRTTRFSKIKEREDKAKEAEKERIRAIVNDASRHDLMSAVPANFSIAKLDIPSGSSQMKGNPNG